MTAGIIGATGYAGAEIARILLSHPEVDSLALASVSFEGESFSAVYPNFLGMIDVKLEKPESVIERSGIVFSALTDGLAEEFAALCVRNNIPFIDMSADFRFDEDEETYSAWYGKAYDEPALHAKSVYGLCELNRPLIKAAAKEKPAIIGNPGCYPTCTSLAAWPALAKGLAAEGATIIADAASGVTGGGRAPQRSYHFPECFDSISPYKVGAHRHSPEILRNFGKMSRGTVPGLIFTPHLAPLNRGILATLYIPLAKGYALSTKTEAGRCRPPSKEILKIAGVAHEIYSDFYSGERFVRVLPLGLTAATNRVRASNYCDIAVHISQDGSMLIITSAIDNMVKGAAGQAVQNMNIILGFDEALALERPAALF